MRWGQANLMTKAEIVVVAILTLVVTAAWADSSLDGQPDLAAKPLASLAAIGFEDNCVACHQTVDQSLITLFKSSTHGRIGRACSSCHGGDPAATSKSSAHSGRFVGQPSEKQALLICGSCHSTPLSQLTLGRHFSDKQTARVGCVECHGVHGVGSPNRNFSFSYYCSGCHGLEYLPHLPDPFQKMLSNLDDLNDGVRQFESSGQKLSVDAVTERRQIRRQIAEIVHPTDLKSGMAKAPEVSIRLRALIDLVQRDKRTK